MPAHPTAYHKLMPFGQYKGMSFGYIYDRRPSYLEWLVGKDTMPDNIRKLARQVLDKEPLEGVTIEKLAAHTIILKVVMTDKNKLAVTFSAKDKEFLEKFKHHIDGRKWNDKNCVWEIPCAQIVALVDLAGGTKNINACAKTKALYTEELKRKSDLESIRTKQESEINIPVKQDLFYYQKTGVEFIERAGGRALIADQQGTGKTATSIAYAVYKNLKTIIVCPKSVVPNWEREIMRFAGKKSSIWDGKTHTGRTDMQFFIVHYDAVGKCVADLNNLKADLLICDEATFLKNRQTIRAKSVLGSPKEKRKFPGIKTKHCIFLTGTPILNRPIEAFYLLNYIDNNRFNNFYQFTERYGGWKGDAPRNLEELHQRTKDLVIRRTKADVWKDMPEKIRTNIYIDLSSSEYKEYKKLLDELFKEWSFKGSPTVGSMPKIQQFLNEKKIAKLIEMIDGFLEAEEKVLIFSVYIAPLQFLLDHYKDKARMVHGSMNSTERQDSIDALSNGKADIGLFSLGAGAMGIDGLQKEISNVINLSFWWVPAIHEQAEDRLHRYGQTETVNSYYLMCPGTIDEPMNDLVNEKRAMAEQIIDGRILSNPAGKSYFKEFVQRLNAQYNTQFVASDDEEIPELI